MKERICTYHKIPYSKCHCVDKGAPKSDNELLTEISNNLSDLNDRLGVVKRAH